MIDFEQLTIGQTASSSRAFSEQDLEAFGRLSLDLNPVHFDEEFAKTTLFKTRIVHGFLYASLISGVLGTKLPGAGAVYVSQELKFLRPVYIGETITATVTIVEKDEAKKLLVLETVCTKENGVKVLSGTAKIKC